MKTTLATPAQIKAIYAILHKYNFLDVKEEYILGITNGRTASTKELTQAEVRQFFSIFTNNSAESEKRKAVFASIWKIAWSMGIIYGNSTDDYEMNKAKLNAFCKQKGTVKKSLSQMNLIEMKQTHRQFEAMFKKFNEKKHYVVQS